MLELLILLFFVLKRTLFEFVQSSYLVDFTPILPESLYSINTYLRLDSYDTGYKIILRDLAIVRVPLLVSTIKVKLLLQVDLLLLDVRASDSAIIFCDLLQVSDYTKVFCFESCYLEEILMRCHQAVSLMASQDGIL